MATTRPALATAPACTARRSASASAWVLSSASTIGSAASGSTSLGASIGRAGPASGRWPQVSANGASSRASSAATAWSGQRTSNRLPSTESRSPVAAATAGSVRYASGSQFGRKPVIRTTSRGHPLEPAETDPED